MLNSKIAIALWGLVVLAMPSGAGASFAGDLGGELSFDSYFASGALRVELIHSGNRQAELFALAGVVAEPVWPGGHRYLIDPTGYGKYRYRVLDRATGVEIFTRGYCSLFGEWTTTLAANSESPLAMGETVRFPRPKAPVVLLLEVRDEQSGRFRELSRFDIDPGAYGLGPQRTYPYETLILKDSGRSVHETLDIVVLPDGYTAAQVPKMKADARRFTEVLLGHAPFDRHRDKIAVRLVVAPSRDEGPDEPRKGLFRDTVFDTTFDTFGSARYLTTANMFKVAAVAAQVPYDTVLIMVNTNRYGGGGVYGSWSIFPSDSSYDEYVLVHEFGHGFGGLGDEYFSSQTSYDDDAFYKSGVEPWEPNITAQTERDEVKWRHLIADDTPVPTPDSDEYQNVVGVFEGAGYKARGLYRPTRNSKMFHKGLLPFGPVGEESLELMIRYFTDPEVSR